MLKTVNFLKNKIPKKISQDLELLTSYASNNVLEKLPDSFKETWKIRAFGLMSVPMIAFLGPKVIASDDKQVKIKIPLGYRSKNHLSSMYFGALAVGADLVVGLLAIRHIEKSGAPIQLVFKDFKADYLKRAEGDVIFACHEGEQIEHLVNAADQNAERVHQKIKASAYVPDKFGDEPVATFELTLSLKKRT